MLPQISQLWVNEKLSFGVNVYIKYFTEKQMGSKDYVQIDMISTVAIQKPSNAISPDSKQ
jgi:hypothetical protein